MLIRGATVFTLSLFLLLNLPSSFVYPFSVQSVPLKVSLLLCINSPCFPVYRVDPGWITVSKSPTSYDIVHWFHCRLWQEMQQQGSLLHMTLPLGKQMYSYFLIIPASVRTWPTFFFLSITSSGFILIKFCVFNIAHDPGWDMYFLPNCTKVSLFVTPM